MGGGAARRRSGGRLAAPRESCWRELERAGRGRRGSRPGPGSGERAFGNSPHFGRTYPHKTSFFDDSSAEIDKLGFGKSFCCFRWGPRPIPKSVIIDKRGSKISEDLIYFCDSGSPFSEKMCQNCCKGCQILMSRYLLGAARGSYRQPAEVAGASAARDLPSTRAGGQDDVSSQTNSLK